MIHTWQARELLLLTAAWPPKTSFLAGESLLVYNLAMKNNNAIKKKKKRSEAWQTPLMELPWNQTPFS